MQGVRQVLYRVRTFLVSLWPILRKEGDAFCVISPTFSYFLHFSTFSPSNTLSQFSSLNGDTILYKRIKQTTAFNNQ